MSKSFSHQETMELNQDRYAQYKEEIIRLHKIAKMDEQTDNFYRMNANIWMALNSLINNLDANSSNDKETINLMLKFIELLRPIVLQQKEEQNI
ncbi:hypothetical protein [Staphylococcus hyicus]|uniref:hypothetical protein n=1 Tax=Staphylococcus hyicus TaxID=1284 RepID=UPI003132BAF9